MKKLLYCIMILKKPFITTLLFFSFFLTIQAQNNADYSKNYQLNIKKASSTIKIDGLLTEAVWKNLEMKTDFQQNFPFDTSKAIMQTEVYTTFDENNLYIAAICYQPKKYVVQSLKRDFGNASSDAFFVLIDPFKDKLNGFYFGVTPLGVQKEGLIFNGNDLSADWDNKWFSEATQHEDRYIVEIAIPFKTLRYKLNDQNPNEWNINFCRNNLLINEKSSWAPIGRNFRMVDINFNGQLNWDDAPPKPGSNTVIIPFITGGSNKNFITNSPVKQDFAVGFDAKVALNSSLNLDLTVNPDFAQVEVDRQITNLSRFEISFPERRQFFLENRDLFGSFGTENVNPFFSRRIGLGRNENNGQNVKVPIIAGARMSGRINANWRVGLLNMQTAKSEEFGLPATNFTVAAVQRRIGTRNNLGFIFVNKDELNNKASLKRFNRVAGLDYNLANKSGKLSGKTFLHKTFTPIALKGQFAMGSSLRYNSLNFSFDNSLLNVGKNYIADVGFVTRNAYYRNEGQLSFIFFPKGNLKKKINNFRIGPEFDIFYGKNDKRITDLDGEIEFRIAFQNSAEFSGALISYNYTFLFNAFDPTNTNGVKLPAGTSYAYYSNRFNYRSNQRNPFFISLNSRFGQYFNGRIGQHQTTISYRLQPLGIFSLDINYTKINLPSPYNDAELWLVGPRAELSFSKSVFFNAFLQYNQQVNNFNLNARLQWRFKPMSDFFLVYTDNYFAFSDDKTIINNLPVQGFQNKNRAIVAKFTYWFNK
jgi:hypothetical protein